MFINSGKEKKRAETSFLKPGIVLKERIGLITRIDRKDYKFKF